MFLARFPESFPDPHEKDPDRRQGANQPLLPVLGMLHGVYRRNPKFCPGSGTLQQSQAKKQDRSKSSEHAAVEPAPRAP